MSDTVKLNRGGKTVWFFFCLLERRHVIGIDPVPFEPQPLRAIKGIVVQFQPRIASPGDKWGESNVEYASPVRIHCCSRTCVLEDSEGRCIVAAEVDTVEVQRLATRVLDCDSFCGTRSSDHLIAEIEVVGSKAHRRWRWRWGRGLIATR